MTKLKFIFEVGNINGTSMKLDILVNDASIKHFDSLPEGNTEIELDIVWPSIVKFITSNKNSGDTIIDSTGNIVKDKYIRLDKLFLNNVEVNQLYLTNKLYLYTEHNTIENTDYWGFNGQCSIEFTGKDTLEWHLNSFIN